MPYMLLASLSASSLPMISTWLGIHVRYGHVLAVLSAFRISHMSSTAGFWRSSVMALIASRAALELQKMYTSFGVVLWW